MGHGRGKGVRALDSSAMVRGAGGAMRRGKRVQFETRADLLRTIGKFRCTVAVALLAGLAALATLALLQRLPRRREGQLQLASVPGLEGVLFEVFEHAPRTEKYPRSPAGEGLPRGAGRPGARAACRCLSLGTGPKKLQQKLLVMSGSG